MAKLTSIALMVLVGASILSSRTMAQSDNAAKPDSAPIEKRFKVKKITISGTVGAAGLTLLSDRDNRIWNVLNPDSLKNSEGRRVTVKAVLARNANEINVSVVRLREGRLTAKLDDSAFRR